MLLKGGPKGAKKGLSDVIKEPLIWSLRVSKPGVSLMEHPKKGPKTANGHLF